MKGVDLDVEVDKYDLEFSAKDGAKSRESRSFFFFTLSALNCWHPGEISLYTPLEADTLQPVLQPRLLHNPTIPCKSSLRAGHTRARDQ